MAIEMPKLSASRPAWSMNGSRSRRVSQTASGPMTEPKGTTSPAKVDRCAATAVLRTAWSTATAPVASLPPPAVRLVPHWGQMVACWSSLAEQAGHVLFMTAPSSAPSLGGACWYAIDDRPPGRVRRQPHGVQRQLVSDGWAPLVRAASSIRSAAPARTSSFALPRCSGVARLTAIDTRRPRWTGAPWGWGSLERRSIVEVAAAFGLPFPPLGAVALAAFGGAFDFGGGELQAGPDLIGLDFGHRPLVALGGLPGPLAEPAGDHDPVTLAKGVGQVLGLAAPDIDPQERGVAVAPLAVLLDPLGHRDPQVGHGDAGVGEAELGILDQVADDGGVVVRCHESYSLCC